jgi:hypothetical protein
MTDRGVVRQLTSVNFLKASTGPVRLLYSSALLHMCKFLDVGN